jgi:tetratricopeptide (TPR) repeat protein
VAETVAAYQTQVRERLRQAELERTAALARAEEEQRRRVAEQAKAATERKRRRVTVVLAVVATLFVLALAGAGIWYYQDQAAQADEETARAEENKIRLVNEAQQAAAEEAHHKALEEQVSSALDDTDQRRKELQKQLGNPLTVSELLSDPELWQVRLDMAGAAWKRAKELAASAAQPLGKDLAARLAAAEKQLEADKNDLQIARKLDDIHLLADRKDVANRQALRKMVAAETAAVFKELGYDVQHGELTKVAAQISQSPLRFVLVAALDHWADMTHFEDRMVLKRLLPLARAVDPDTWRDRLRDEQKLWDSEALLKLAAEVDPAKQPPHILWTLAQKLDVWNKRPAAVTLLNKALLSYPKDFWLHFEMGLLMNNPAEKAGCYLAALAIRPNSVGAHNQLGMALHALKDYDGAIAHFQKAIASDPQCATAYNNWGGALLDTNDLAGAAAKYHLALKIRPGFAVAYSNLGSIQLRKKDPDGAILLYRKALDLFPQLEGSPTQGGSAIDEERLQTLAGIHYGLGRALDDAKQYDEAVAHYLKALRINPKVPLYHGYLARALLHQGKFAEARNANLHYLKLLSPGHPLQAEAQKQLQESEQLLALDQKLADVKQGKIQRPTTDDQLALARLCYVYKKQYAAAAQFFADAFTADPSLAALFPHRQVAAGAAALAGTGQGKDADQLDAPAKAKLRQQALDWLQAELAARTKQFQSGLAPSIAVVAKNMPIWQIEPDLAGVRDEPALAKLPKAEQEAWHQFWTEVGKLSKQAQSRFTETKMQGTLTAAKRQLVYPIKLAAGKTYVLEVESKVFDPYLRLEDAQGKLLAEYMQGNKLNSGIIFIAPQDGTYRVLVTSLPQQATGAYTLTMWEYTGK